MSLIRDITAREIMDSRGYPTIEVDLTTKTGIFRAAAPPKPTENPHQASRQRDNESQSLTKEVQHAVNTINGGLQILRDRDVSDERKIDELLCEEFSVLGANALLAISMVICRASAAFRNKTLYQHISELAQEQSDKFILPVPAFNVINCGSHSGGTNGFKLLIYPTGAATFREALHIGAEVYRNIHKIARDTCGQEVFKFDDEGGVAPDLEESFQAIDILKSAIQMSKHPEKVQVGIHIGASTLFDAGQKKYLWNCKEKGKSGPDLLTTEVFTEHLKRWIGLYPFVSIEDPFDKDDWASYRSLTTSMQDSKPQIVMSALFQRDLSHISKAMEPGSGATFNSILVKADQIGSVTEAIKLRGLCKNNNREVTVARGLGETEDTFLADLCVGLRCGQIKIGAPSHIGSVAKYNQLLRIEEELGNCASYAGAIFGKP